MAKPNGNSGQNVPARKGRGKIWVMAVDPFAGFDLKPVLSFAKENAERAGATLHAVYVLAPAGLNWTGEFSDPWIQRYMPVSEAKLDEVLGDMPIERRVITRKQPGHKHAAQGLVSFATKVKAECILISTHGRHGLERMALGSFAEAVIMMSKIPVIITNPERNVPKEVKKILVPTDLSKSSMKFVSNIADYAKKLNAEIVLYYKQPDPLDPIIQQGVYSLGGGWISVQKFVDAELARKTKQIEKLEWMLRKKSVPVSHVLDSSPGDLVESIDRVARENGADMCAVLTHAGAWTATMLGSVARGLVRHASVPVMVKR